MLSSPVSEQMFAARPVASDVQIMTVLVVSFRQKNPTCVDRAWTTTQLYLSSKSRRTDRMIRMTNRSKNDCNSFSQSPENEGLSWPHKIGRFARSLWQGPKKSLIVLLQHERSNRWRMGTLNENPAMQIIADFYLTNITHEDVFVLKTFFVPYHGKGWFPSSLACRGECFGEESCSWPEAHQVDTRYLRGSPTRGMLTGGFNLRLSGKVKHSEEEAASLINLTMSTGPLCSTGNIGKREREK